MAERVHAADRRRLGFVLPRPFAWAEPDQLRAFLVAAEDLGYRYVRLLDHVVGADRRRVRIDGPYDHRDPFYEPFTMAGFVAGCTSLEISTGVLVLPQRQTVLAAKQAAEIDQLSGGRLRLGLGVGWNEHEFRALDVPFSGRGVRIEEQIKVLRRLWTDELVTFRGLMHDFEDVGLNPLPRQRPIPLWLGTGTGPLAVRRVATLADGWLPSPFVPIDAIGPAFQDIRDMADAEGRDGNAIGLEGRVDLGGRGSPVEEQVAFWSALGASHIALKTFDLAGDGFSRRSDALAFHLDVLADAIDRAQNAVPA
jgi:probable F420-dependent oxidoreductase